MGKVISGFTMSLDGFIAEPNDDGPVGLLGQPPRLERQCGLADVNLTLVHKTSMGSRSPVCGGSMEVQYELTVKVPVRSGRLRTVNFKL